MLHYKIFEGRNEPTYHTKYLLW